MSKTNIYISGSRNSNISKKNTGDFTVRGRPPYTLAVSVSSSFTSQKSLAISQRKRDLIGIYMHGLESRFGIR